MTWHLSELHGPGRDTLEAHLGACLACVGAAIELKRALDSEDGPLPSAPAAARLRAAAVELSVGPVGAWWERPVAFAVAAASVAVAVLLVNAA